MVRDAESEWFYVEVPADAPPGSVYELRVPCFIGDGWEPARVHEMYPISTPQALDESHFLCGFANLKITPGKRLTEFPLVVVRAPAPREGESLVSGLTHRWSEFDIVEINGVPQPMAYFNFKDRGHSYEEFSLLNNSPLDPMLGLSTTHRFLRLVHKQTRSVCSSRVAEWRQGKHWYLREENGDGRELIAITDLSKHRGLKINLNQQPRVGPRGDLDQDRAALERELAKAAPKPAPVIVPARGSSKKAKARAKKAAAAAAVKAAAAARAAVPPPIAPSSSAFSAVDALCFPPEAQYTDDPIQRPAYRAIVDAAKADTAAGAIARDAIGEVRELLAGGCTAAQWKAHQQKQIDKMREVMIAAARKGMRPEDWGADPALLAAAGLADLLEPPATPTDEPPADEDASERARFGAIS